MTVISLLSIAILLTTMTSSCSAYSGVLTGLISQSYPGPAAVPLPQIQTFLNNQPFATQLLFYAMCGCKHGSYADCMNTTFVYNQLKAVWEDNHNIPIVTWMPYACTNPTVWICDQISSGMVDRPIDLWAKLIGRFIRREGPDGLGEHDNNARGNKKLPNRRVYLRPMHEMNGNWYPWGDKTSNSTPPSGYIKAFQYLVTKIRNVSATSRDELQVLWCVSDRSSFDGYNLHPDVGKWYPGHEYVDWAAIDGYNTPAYQNGNWSTFSFIFDSVLANVLSVTNNSKPIAIPETGCDDENEPANFPKKGAWLREMALYVTEHPSIKLLCYFNVEKEEQGSYHYWAVAATTYSAFRPFPNYYTGWVEAMMPGLPPPETAAPSSNSEKEEASLPFSVNCSIGATRVAQWLYSCGQDRLVNDDQFIGKN